ncbi:MAG TPA: hypothetical protein VN878_09085 [Usitatibacter sp.]|nr:hypothetical protein [Usitatibacter sp.]
MDLSSWQQRMMSRKSERDLVAALRDYLAGWLPEDFLRLPEACRPGKIRDGEDIYEWAFTLTRYRFSSGPALLSRLEEMEVVFSQAATRLSQLRATCSREASETSEAVA